MLLFAFILALGQQALCLLVASWLGMALASQYFFSSKAVTLKGLKQTTFQVFFRSLKLITFFEIVWVLTAALIQGSLPPMFLYPILIERLSKMSLMPVMLIAFLLELPSVRSRLTDFGI